MPFPSVPLWRECLTKAQQDNASKQHCQYIQLATCDNAGVPECRTLVFRGFAEQSDSLIAHTDLRSEKIRHIRANNRGEICWYFSETREQFRLAGTIEIVATEKHFLGDVRKQHWQKLSSLARASYYQAAPGSALDGEQENSDKQITAEKINGAPAKTFALLIFKPSSIDHLLLQPTPQRRSLHKLNSSNTWHSERVNP
ncbi:MAG: pyridoxamine 5'-phosphate oxidase [Paraglaciecola sp.]|jgi:pyridoxamine 5'-phosphate oxidase